MWYLLVQVLWQIHYQVTLISIRYTPAIWDIHLPFDNSVLTESREPSVRGCDICWSKFYDRFLIKWHLSVSDIHLLLREPSVSGYDILVFSKSREWIVIVYYSDIFQWLFLSKNSDRFKTSFAFDRFITNSHFLSVRYSPGNQESYQCQDTIY